MHLPPLFVFHLKPHLMLADWFYGYMLMLFLNFHLLDLCSFIDKQIRSNNPPETALTYIRLKNEGFDDFTVKQLIGQCVAVEIYNILKFKKPLDKDRFLRSLDKLPKEPFDKNF